MKLFLLRIIFKLLSFLPLCIIRKIGALVGVIAIKLSKRSSKRLKDNLVATGMCNKEDVEQYAKLCAKEMGKTLIESIAIAWNKTPLDCAKLIVKWINLEEVKKASELGPIVFLTPHIGNFEVAVKATALQMQDKVFNILYKPNKDPIFNTIMLNGRTEENINPVPTTRYGVAKLLRALKDSQMVGILPDNVASSGDGVWVDFFGKKVFATTLAAKLSMFEGVTTFLVTSKRVKTGFIVEFFRFTPKVQDVSTIVQEIYREIEKIVLMAPTQYYWSYDRFRVPHHAPTIDKLT